MPSPRWMLLVISIAAVACSSPKEEAPKSERPAQSQAQSQAESQAPVQAAAVPAATDTAAAAKCVHGVDQTLCTRCDPRLEAVFKAKGDWCAEHNRPESQCVLCNPELAALGVK